MIQAVDHIVILVRDLAAATADYTALGFLVTPGGSHRDGSTHNALVSFADGVYLELLAFQHDAPAHRWWRHVAAGEGLIDFALLPEVIAEDVAAASRRGLALVGPNPGGRTRPDGVRLEWQTAYAASSELPFLCGDVTPRSLRVPGPASWEHANGVRGLSRVNVAVRDLDTSAARYAALLGHQALVELGRRLFKLGDCYLALRSPGLHEPESDELVTQLATRGEGIYSLAMTSPTHLVDCDLRLAHGARITIS